MTSPSAVNCLAGGPFASGDPHTDDYAELRSLTDEIAEDAAARRHRAGSERPGLDAETWSHLVASGLHRLSSADTSESGPVETAVVLHRLARQRASVPVAETDLLGAWLATTAGIATAHDRPLTVAIADRVECTGESLVGTVSDVPWGLDADVLLAVRVQQQLLVASVADVPMREHRTVAGEPGVSFDFAVPRDVFVALDHDAGDELVRRGAWARCVQIIGALDAAADMSSAHARGRTQFGRHLVEFQAVQHSLAVMAGEVERARSTSTLAVVAAAEHGFGSRETDYAVTLARVTLGQVVPTVTRIAHQLHGAVGVTLEHGLWSATMRAHGWLDDYGCTSAYAMRLGRMALQAFRSVDRPWGTLFGYDLAGWRDVDYAGCP